MGFFELTADQQDLLERVGQLGHRWASLTAEWDKQDASPLHDLLAQARAADVVGLTVPKRYGGQDRNIIDYALAVEHICRITKSWLPAEVLFRTSGPAPAIIMAAENEACKEKFLPDIVAGRKTATIALTEPEHGSDMTDLETIVTEEADAFVLNGSKRYITGAVEDDLYATFVRFNGIRGPRGIGAVIVEKNLPGLRMERGPEVMGARGTPHGNLIFENCRVPKENLVLREGNFPRLMRAFNVERMHNAALSVGLGAGAYDDAIAHIRKRKQFGRHLIEFQAVYHSVAEMWVKLESARNVMLKAALTSVDGKFPKVLEVNVAKNICNRVGREVSFEAMQLHGGDGVTMDCAVQQAFRDVVVASYGGGVAPVLNNVIAAQLLGTKFDQHA